MSRNIAAVMVGTSRRFFLAATAYSYQTTVAVGRLRLHIFWRGDPGEAHHDHPWDFTTFPLVSYVEEFLDVETGYIGQRVVHAFRRTRRPAETAHKILGRWRRGVGPGAHRASHLRVVPGPVITLCWRGPHRRDWFYYLKRGGEVRRLPPRQYLALAEKHPMEATHGRSS